MLHYLLCCTAAAVLKGDDDRYESASNVPLRVLRAEYPDGGWHSATAKDRVEMVQVAVEALPRPSGTQYQSADDPGCRCVMRGYDAPFGEQEGARWLRRPSPVLGPDGPSVPRAGEDRVRRKCAPVRHVGEVGMRPS